ncbi:toxic membrane protein [Escherichia coli]|nr:toxic membrane protein [Escherichia coli]
MTDCRYLIKRVIKIIIAVLQLIPSVLITQGNVLKVRPVNQSDAPLITINKCLGRYYIN